MLFYSGLAVLLVLLAAIVQYTNCAPLATKNEDLFEGDILISEEMIRRYYNITDYEVKTGKRFYNHTRTERGATSVSSLLWPNGIVYYTFSTSLPTSVAMTARNAMDDFEVRTCLRFVVNNSGNHIIIGSDNSGCRSHVGMQGGQQNIWLENPRCNRFGTAVHEIGHAIGFWHEQSRPDRDSYVNILYQNIKPSERSNFMKRTDINSLGSEYDYDSVMHYKRDHFSRNGRTTVEVNNPAAYAIQGRPKLGRLAKLSIRDRQQVNSLYKCPKPGVTGRLRIRVKSANNLPDTDPWLNAPDPYVRITAVRSTSTDISQTSIKSGTQNPSWFELFDFNPYKWKYFRVQIWDSDSGLLGGDDEMSVSQTFAPTVTGTRKNVKHCTNPSCSGYLWLDIYFCPNGWAGENCARRAGSLSLNIYFGRNLPDRDPPRNASDPYVEVIAYNSEGISVRKVTAIKVVTRIQIGMNTYILW